MYLAMNRFKVIKGQEEVFEAVWKGRDSRLGELAGFKSFHLLKGPESEDGETVLFASHTIWETKEDFLAWTKSQQFRDAHKNAGSTKGLYTGHPQFEGFEVVVYG